MQYELTYRKFFFGQQNLKKSICYITPIFRIGKHDWVIVVEKECDRLSGKRQIYPMWRRPQPDDQDAGFPTDWRSMQVWYTYNGHDRASLGLPRSLADYYREHKEDIAWASLHGCKPSPNRWFDLTGQFKRLTHNLPRELVTG